MERIGKRIKELRNEAECTQNVLANALGVTQDSISLWENGKRIPDTQYVVAIAKFFDVTTDYLLGLSEDVWIKVGSEQQGKAKLSKEEERILESYRKLSEAEKEKIRSRL